MNYFVRSLGLLFLVWLLLLGEALAGKKPKTYFTPEMARLTVAAATRHGVPALLILEVMRQESAFKASATSYKDGQPCAHGLLQLTKSTALRFGVTNPYDPLQAIEGGARYLHWLIEQFGADRLDLVLAGYNAGEGAVVKYRNTVPPYAETLNYVRVILARYYRAVQFSANLPQPRHLPQVAIQDKTNRLTVTALSVIPQLQ